MILEITMINYVNKDKSRFSMGIVSYQGLIYIVGGCTHSRRHMQVHLKILLTMIGTAKIMTFNMMMMMIFDVMMMIEVMIFDVMMTIVAMVMIFDVMMMIVVIVMTFEGMMIIEMMIIVGSHRSWCHITR